MTERMTVEELVEHATQCYQLAQTCTYLDAINPSDDKKEAMICWRKAAKRAEYRADCIECGKGDPEISPPHR